MQGFFSNTAEERNLRFWSGILMALAGLGICWPLFVLARAAVGSDFRIGLFTTNGLESLIEKDFTTSQRLTVVSLCLWSEVCWIFCMFQFVLMGRQCSRGEVLSVKVVRCRERFAGGLLALSVSEAFVIPCTGAYLRSLEKIGPL